MVGRKRPTRPHLAQSRSSAPASGRSPSDQARKRGRAVLTVLTGSQCVPGAAYLLLAPGQDSRGL